MEICGFAAPEVAYMPNTERVDFHPQTNLFLIY